MVGQNFDEREHKDNVFRIGNLTLLASIDNRPGTSDNGSFSEKTGGFPEE